MLLTYLPYALPVALIAMFYFSTRPDLTGAQARELVAQGALLIDVRSPSEFAGGHLPGARNLPVQTLAGQAAGLGPPTLKVIVYCASGTRSAMAKRILRAAGFRDTLNLGSMAHGLS